MASGWRKQILLAVMALAVFATPLADAEDAGPGPADSGGADSSQERGADAAAVEPLDAAPVPDDLRALVSTTDRVSALLRGELDVEVSPSDLFEVRLDDERAVLVQVQRLSTLLKAVHDAGAGVSGAKHKKGLARADADASSDASMEAATLDAELWRAQLDLDRARLSFLELPKARRDELLAKHVERQEAAKKAKENEITEAQRKAEQAERARQAALEEVKRAQSEAARLLAEERVRLLGVRQKQAQFEADLARRGNALGERAELALTWRRRIAELVEARRTGQKPAADADTLYSELIDLLRNRARADLSIALDELSTGQSAVPSVGPDTLDTAGAVVDRSEIGLFGTCRGDAARLCVS